MGNKTDMEQERMVTEEEGRTLAKKLNIPFFETSVKENLNVEETFDHLVNLIMEEMGDEKGILEESLQWSPEEPSVKEQSQLKQHKPSTSENKCCS